MNELFLAAAKKAMPWKSPIIIYYETEQLIADKLGLPKEKHRWNRATFEQLRAKARIEKCLTQAMNMGIFKSMFALRCGISLCPS